MNTDTVFTARKNLLFITCISDTIRALPIKGAKPKGIDSMKTNNNRKYTTRKLAVGDVVEKDDGFLVYVVGANTTTRQTLDGTVEDMHYSIFTCVNITASHGSMNARGYNVVGILTDKGLEQARRGTVPPSGEILDLEEHLIYDADLADKVNKIEALYIDDKDATDYGTMSNMTIDAILAIILA
jgi:hypothetical protein